MYYQVLKFELSQHEIKPRVVNYDPLPYPQFISFQKDQAKKIIDREITAQSAIIFDKDSSVVLYQKNANLRFSMASTTKIMTALVALDIYQPTDPITIFEGFKDGVEGAVVGFEKGEQVTFEDMLYAMLLPSGNDAAIALAANYSSGYDAFVKKMNQKAAELSLSQTHFGDPTGLTDEQDYSTVLDLARLASYSLGRDEFAKVVGTKEYVVHTIDKKKTYFVQNLNRLLGSYQVTGVKTGFTNEAGEVLVTSKSEKGHTIIIVVMKSEDRFLDTEKLLSLIDSNISYTSF